MHSLLSSDNATIDPKKLRPGQIATVCLYFRKRQICDFYFGTVSGSREDISPPLQEDASNMADTRLL